MSNEAHWTGAAWDHFVGRRIASVRYMTDKEAEKQGWYNRPLVLYFEDGHWMCPQMDDEGNDAGALAATGEVETWPVISLGFEKGNLAPLVKSHNAAMRKNKITDTGTDETDKIPSGIKE